MSQHDLVAELKEHTFKTAGKWGRLYVFTSCFYYCWLFVEFRFLKRCCRAWRHITTIAASHAQSLVWPQLINNNRTCIQKLICVSLYWTLPTISVPHRLRLQVSQVGLMVILQVKVALSFSFPKVTSNFSVKVMLIFVYLISGKWDLRNTKTVPVIHDLFLNHTRCSNE